MDGTTFVPRLLHSFAFWYTHGKNFRIFSFFLVYKHYVMLQFPLSRLCWLEIALQSAPPVRRGPPEKRLRLSFILHFVLFFHDLMLLFFWWTDFWALLLLEQVGDVWANLCFAILWNFLFWAEKNLKAWILCLSEANSLILNFQNIFLLIMLIWIAAKHVLCQSMSTRRAH